MIATALAVVIVLAGPAWAVACALHHHREARRGISKAQLDAIDARRLGASPEDRSWRASLYAAVAVFGLWCFKPDELPLIILAVSAGATVGWYASGREG